MANSSEFRSGLSVFLQKKASKRLKNLLFNAMPTVEFFFALSGDKTGADGLGRPKSHVMVSALNGVAGATREKIMAEREYKPLVQTTKPSKTEVKKMTDFDSDPTVPAFDTTNDTLSWFSQPRFKFSRTKMPYKVAHSNVRTAKSSARTEGEAAAAIRSVYDAEVKTREGVMVEQLNDELFKVNGQPGYPSNEDAVTWDHFHSLQAAFSDGTNGPGTTYGGVDRSIAANSWWRGNYYTTSFTGNMNDLIDYANYDLNMIKKGLGVQMLAVGKTLMKRAKAEAKAEGYQMMTNGIPEYPEYGFKREIIRVWTGNRPVYIYYEPAIDDVDSAAGAGSNGQGYAAAAIDPSTFTIIIPSDRNFKISKPVAANEVDEGGDEADFGTIEVEILMACEVPSGNAWFSNIQA